MALLTDWRTGLRDEVLSAMQDGLVLPKATTNANPLNVAFTDRINWRGQIGHSVDGYVIFLDASYGIRAAALELGLLWRLTKHRSIRSLLGTWYGHSPETQDNLINYVAGVMGMPSDETVDIDIQGRIVIRAIIGFECGTNWKGRRITDFYTNDFIRDAVASSHII